MIEIALFLTAVPLAVALAMLLNALLDSRVAAVVGRRSTRSRLGILVLFASLAAAPALAADTYVQVAGDDRDEIGVESSLIVDAVEVERLWSQTPSGVQLISQSRIPVAVETNGSTEEFDTRPLVVERDGKPRARKAPSSPTTP